MTATGLSAKMSLLLEAVKFEHTIFALPFAYLGMTLAAGGLPTWHQFWWITMAMVGARTLAMSSNRIIDREFDAANPRTAQRALPRGLLSFYEMLALGLASAALLIVAAWQLNDLCLKLSPLAIAIVVGYSYTKRFTWASHFILGMADALAPLGGWLGVRGTLDWPALLLGFAVATWIAGFDLLYACQDVDFDHKAGLWSVPAQFGVAIALRLSTALHVLTSAALLAVGLMLSLGLIYFLGWLIATALLLYEHRLVSPDDLSRLDVAFFNVNGYIAICVFAFTLVSLWLR